MTATDTDLEPRVWIGCLACYNGGDLVGAWVDAADGPGYVPEGHAQRCLRCAAWWNEGDWQAPGTLLPAPTCPAPDRDGMHYLGIVGPEGDPHEEQWVMDHEGFGGLLSGECSPAEAARIAEAIERIQGEGYDVAAVAAWRANIGAEYADLEDLSDFAEAFCGTWDSGLAYAEELAEELGAFVVEAEPYGGNPVDLEGRWPFSCIDWERAWRELEMGDGYWTAEAGPGEVYVFRPS